MVTSADAAIEPWAMMVISFYALVANIAVIASGQLDDLAVEANLVNCKPIQ